MIQHQMIFPLSLGWKGELVEIAIICEAHIWLQVQKEMLPRLDLSISGVMGSLGNLLPSRLIRYIDKFTTH